MSAVVQARCPGCEKVLRIPAEWLSQAFRCKHCGATIQPRPRTNPAATTPPPAPQARPAPAVPVPPPPPPKLDLPLPPSPPRAAVPPAAVRAASPPPAYPVARPAVNDSPFGDLEPDDTPRSPRRSRPGTNYVGLYVVAGILLLAGVITAVFWDNIAPALQKAKEEKQSRNNKKAQDGDTPAPTTQGEPRPRPTSGTDTPRPTTGETPRPRPTTPVVRPSTPQGPYPRRALVISVHNYLYANPTHYGSPGSDEPSLQGLVSRALYERKGFAIPRPPGTGGTYVTHLSDVSARPASPTRPIIEKTLESFLAACRAQDRVLVFFSGHGAEIEGKAYLAPIEGDLTDASTLIPLEWVYSKLKECKARQKVLVIDVFRYNEGRGSERVVIPPMPKGFHDALKSPPEGVQVWTSCVEGEYSLEFENDRLDNSIFVRAFWESANAGISGVRVEANDLFPVEQLNAETNARIQKLLLGTGKKMTSALYGKPPASGASYDPKEPFPVNPKIATLEAEGGIASLDTVRTILKEINVPPVKKTQSESLLKAEALPAFPAKVLDRFPVDNSPSPLKEAVERAQGLLWAVSGVEPPADLREAVNRYKQKSELRNTLQLLREGYPIPGGQQQAENRFKAMVEEDGRRLGNVLRILTDEVEALKKVGEKRDEAPRRWQANYDFILARLLNQLAYTYEYASALGSLRKEFPPRQPEHTQFRLASTKRLQGDGAGRKAGREAEALLKKIAREYKDTPWEVLAKRELFTSLGLEWKAQ